HTFFIFGLSFVILSMFWMLHHNQFNFINKTKKANIWINLTFLMLISLMPFTSSLIGDYPNELSARIFFNINLFLLGFLLYLNWAYASRKDIVEEEILSKEEIKRKEKICMILPSLALVSIGISFFIPLYSPIVYALSPIIKRVIS
ncbi:MAG: TMEM175 family protein, partial [Thermoplasmatota archaeon]